MSFKREKYAKKKNIIIHNTINLKRNREQKKSEKEMSSLEYAIWVFRSGRMGVQSGSSNEKDR